METVWAPGEAITYTWIESARPLYRLNALPYRSLATERLSSDPQLAPTRLARDARTSGSTPRCRGPAPVVCACLGLPGRGRVPPPLPASCSRTVCPLPHQLTCSSEVPVTEVGGVSREVPTRVSEPPKEKEHSETEAAFVGSQAACSWSTQKAHPWGC